MDTVPQHEGKAPAPTRHQDLDAVIRASSDGILEPDEDVDPVGSAHEEDYAPHEPLPFQRWIKRSASGAVLSGIALGLQQVYQPKRELPAFVMEATGEPEDPNARINLHFDPDDPMKTVAVVRTPAPGAQSDAPPGPED